MKHTTASTRARRPRRRGALHLASLALIGGLTLTACAPGGPDDAAMVATAQTSTEQTSVSGAGFSSSSSVDATTTTETISATRTAAEAFMATLSDEQVETLTYGYDDETRSTSWSNFPVTFVERAGLNLAELTDEQKSAALGRVC